MGLCTSHLKDDENDERSPDFQTTVWNNMLTNLREKKERKTKLNELYCHSMSKGNVRLYAQAKLDYGKNKLSNRMEKRA